MPTYEHTCTAENCLHEWEDFYSIKTAPPTVCPKCKQETAQRVINCGTKGVVVLSGHELTAKHKEDVQKLKQEVYGDAKKYANIVGEDRYHNIQSKMDKNK